MPEENPLFNFTAVDLETTGLDPIEDRIIEIGAVRFRDGQVAEEFSRLVDPQRPLPKFITRLTGIAEEDLRGQPIIDQVLPEAVEFIGDDPLVAHNAPFDVSFLQAALGRLDLSSLANLAFDTVSLSCILLPGLRDHRLATLTEFYDIPLESAHRATDDARATGRLFLSLVHLMAAQEPASLALLTRLTAGTGSSLEMLFAHGLRAATTTILTRKIPGGTGRDDLRLDLSNFFGRAPAESPASPAETPRPLDLDQLEALFGAETNLGDALGHYEQRPQQVRMLRGVGRAFNSREFLAVEAGTGTGKSLAYLMPAAHWALRNEERVIISTHTKNLQEQLFYKDIPLLREALGLDFTAALIKGRRNYICLNKWHWILSQAEHLLAAEERLRLLPLVLWSEQTQTGDVVENTGFRMDPDLWSKVCGEHNYCLGPRCQYHGRCFIMRIRRAALEAHIVVVNHSLFFSDLASDHAVLSDYEHVIFDEAHRLEEVATQYLGYELNWWSLRTLLNRLHQREGGELGTLPALRRRISRAAIADSARQGLLKVVDRALEERGETWRSGLAFFQLLTESALSLYGREKEGYVGKYRYRQESQLLKLIGVSGGGLEDALVRIKNSLVDVVGMLETLEPKRIKDGERLREDLLARTRDCQELIDALGHLMLAEEDQYVYWVETPVREDGFDTRMLSAPLNIAQLMRSLVYNRLQTAVHTSATLTVAGRFEYFLGRIGLHLVEPERLRTLALGSPFDFEEQALVCLPSYLPSPKDPRFTPQVIEALHAALLASRGGALVLFTSYEMLNRAYQELADRLSQQGITVLGQGKDGSRTHILNRFREERESVLMGTASFWEGVDIPGETLRSLVLVKLPFLVPTEPVVEAHVEQLEKQGRNSFSEYILPEAVIRFRQGFGRLIRRRDDRGVVLILDRRVLSTRYGATFLRSLPTPTWVVDTPEMMVEDIHRWLEHEKKPPRGGLDGTRSI